MQKFISHVIITRHNIIHIILISILCKTVIFTEIINIGIERGKELDKMSVISHFTFVSM